jgi:hypothetical protein
MLRIFVEVLLPLALPTALYFVWLRLARRWRRGGGWRGAPWLWLAGGGVILLGIALFVAVLGFGTAQRGVYVPPRWVNGRIVPGHVAPGRAP